MVVSGMLAVMCKERLMPPYMWRDGLLFIIFYFRHPLFILIFNFNFNLNLFLLFFSFIFCQITFPATRHANPTKG